MKYTQVSCKELAEQISSRVCYEDMNHNFGGWRATTKAEQKKFFPLIYGALMGLVWGNSYQNTDKVQAIADCSEFQFNDVFRASGLRGYESIYMPIKTAANYFNTLL